MTKQQIVAVDVDGVVADLHTTWLDCYNRDWDDSLTIEDVTCWDMERVVKPECGNGIFKYLEDPGLYAAVKPIPGALDGIKALREMGTRVIFATSVNMHQSGQKLKWLAYHGFLELDFGNRSRDYVESVDKSLVRADVLIDDWGENLKTFEGGRILFDQPYNRAETRYLTMLNWRQVTDILYPSVRGK